MVATLALSIVPSRVLSVFLGPDYVDNVSLADPTVAATSARNLVAYRPRYSASHGSNLGVLMFNIPGIFPCVSSLEAFWPLCGRKTFEEDGFLGGRSFVEAGDGGNNFRIFSSTENIRTYGIGLEGCPELNRSCLPNYVAFSITCLLPREQCG